MVLTNASLTLGGRRKSVHVGSGLRRILCKMLLELAQKGANCQDGHASILVLGTPPSTAAAASPFPMEVAIQAARRSKVCCAPTFEQSSLHRKEVTQWGGGSETKA